MSIDATNGDDARGETAAGERGDEFTCGVCGDGTDAAGGRYLAAYPTDASVALAHTERDGLLALCGQCSDDVDELTDAWDDCGQPAVASTATIAAAYGDAATDCSFCEGAVDDGPVLGLDDWSGNDGDDVEHDASTHYALCESCVPIFAEFLSGIAPET